MNPMRRRCLAFSGSMVATSLIASLLAPSRRSRSHEQIDLEKLFPAAFGSWRTSGGMDAFVRPADRPTSRIYDQVLERTYVRADGAVVMLSVAFGGNQSDGLELHRPEVCYQYGGFHVVRGALPDDIRTAQGMVAVNRLVAEAPGRPEAITYWVTLAGETVRDANTFRLLSLYYSARRLIVDGMLARISTIDPVPARAYRVHDAFVSNLMNALPETDRSVVFGRPDRPESSLGA